MANISHEDYLKAKKIVEEYENQEFMQGCQDAMFCEACQAFSEFDCVCDELEPCSVCGEIDGMVNPCCASYDPLHHDNCGYS